MEAELLIYKRPKLIRKLTSIRKHIYEKVGDIQSFVTIDNEPIPFEKRKERKYHKIKKGESWGKAFSCAWFHILGRIPETVIGQHIVLVVDIDGEGLIVDDNNNPVSAISSRLSFVERFQSTKGKTLIEVSDLSKGGEEIDIWIEAGFNGKLIPPFGKSHFKEAFIARSRDDIKAFYYDFLTLCYAALGMTNTNKQKEMFQILEKSYSLLHKYTNEDIKKAKMVLREYINSSDNDEFTFTAIGHSHLDLAWLWPIRETKRKSIRTFMNTLNYLDKYPEYIYGASQPQQFAWIKNNYPMIFEKLKERVKQGRIELQGGMWVESDTNLPNGESLVRQIYYGKKFFKEEFNQDMRICWLPDAFGFNANLPQILKKTGIDYFMTIKLTWNEYNEFPHHSFWWQGIDGSSILVHMPPEGNYNSGATPLSIIKAKDKFKEKSILSEALVVYGTGDGGGGPGEVHIELINRQHNLSGFPKVKFGKAIDFFDRLKKDSVKLKTFQGELYLEKHQGTYTTQANNKFYNRRIEFLLHDIEVLGTMAYLEGYDYPHELLEGIWKQVLLYQFHDILPGSSIKRVYDESVKRYQEMISELEDVKQDILRRISNGEGKTFINTTSFPREDFIKHENQWYLAKASEYSSSKLLPIDDRFELNYGEDYIENAYLRVKFSKQGYIVSLYDKKNMVECCKEYLNKLILYKDKWKFFNAWDIDINYYQKRKHHLKLYERKIYIDGPSVVCRNYYRHRKTTLVQDVILFSGKQYLVFDTTCDYHETFKMLRTDFIPTIYSDTVKCDIQFGNYDRSTKSTTSKEKAQFEICAHKWIDLSDNDYGIALINDCKYGHRVKEGIISLNLLRSPIYPDPKADRGKHHFKYAIYPHKGSFGESEVVKFGYHFNMKPLLCDMNITSNHLVSTNNKNIVVETIKKAEERDGIIIRIYEAYGRSTSGELTVSFKYDEIFDCDLLENILGKLESLNFSLSPFEIKTILLTI